ncbi:SDR family NAD(P)-dependent oxidoreductase [Aquisalinus flavus]|uniref:3-ketoacyl-ACP reductase n=1 Tax=Aquisalinus flavus TaxID=1526572 RepID=A0A8J2V6W2_9PROT|nr:3-oxoacyl-ACP reductase family protein [Aquisalinus flavus]MBD0426156.1 3-oxoacyl-ACP reductase FabG [Aquisalinus flavus]UNE48266.1 3-oxoacyl-ACP reductase FabG [Aquisalinus flavus]GGD10138.1 3-ketoacyl-ACP reductase [Aquisalinus flavus]
MSHTLKDKNALVTGGTRGIGAAIVRRYAADGANVAFTYHSSKDKADALASEIEALGVTALPIRADAGNPEEAANAVAIAVEALGPLDILVHNAGIAEIGPIGEADTGLLRKVFAVNVDGVYAATHAAVPHLGDNGRIIIIGSVNGEQAMMPGFAIYAASKHAVAGLAKGWARDLAGRGILVNVIQPGPVDTDMNPADGDIAARMTPLLPLGRYAKPEEIAGLAAFLAGPDASYITGATINIDGGLTA